MFFLIASLVVFAGHFYIWNRLVRAPGWPLGWTIAGTVAVVCLALLLPVSMMLIRSLPRGWAGPLGWVAFTWMGMGFLLTVSIFAVDVMKWLGVGAASLWAWIAPPAGGPTDPVRRELLAKGAAGAAAVLATGTGIVALRGGLGEVDVKEVPVKLERLPRELSGYTLVQLTDVHIGPLIGRRFVDQVVDKVNALKPDAVVITGDLVDGSVAELARHAVPLARIASRHGVYFVTGNHEYYSGVEQWMTHLERLGVRVLRNERVSLGDAGASFDLAGIDDEWAARYGRGHGPDLAKALAGRDAERELVLLAHQPKSVIGTAGAGVGLQISGHTHGGQIWPFTGLVHLAQPYVAGLHRHGEDTQIYVSRGTGFWGPPMRLGAPAEVTKIVLT
ncbi:MAG TPA: metallophosphoesterase [Vulgatibacter sp.]|nr:metallophosphoesterase [Vulgatibacter sp.]